MRKPCVTSPAQACCIGTYVHCIEGLEGYVNKLPEQSRRRNSPWCTGTIGQHLDLAKHQVWPSNARSSDDNAFLGSAILQEVLMDLFSCPSLATSTPILHPFLEPASTDHLCNRGSVDIFLPAASSCRCSLVVSPELAFILLLFKQGG